jgi:multifunctional 2-oxoglutarate metabolism enzyme
MVAHEDRTCGPDRLRVPYDRGVADDTDFGPNDWLIAEQYERYVDSPASVSEEWRAFFEAGEGVDEALPGTVAAPPPSTPAPAVSPASSEGGPPEQPAPGPPGPDRTPTPPPDGAEPLRGVAARIVERMEASLGVPTATSFRTMPAKLLEVNRRILNNHLARTPAGGKVSFTHLIGWAVVRALASLPAVNVSFSSVDGVPHVVRHHSVNLGIAVDVTRKDGARSLLVPVIVGAEGMGFRGYWHAYEDLVARVREGRITPDDFEDVTVSLTNPGTLGTLQSVPRLMDDHGLIIGVGSIAFPPQFEGADPDYLAQNGIGRVVTLSSTYDHRVIQGAQSGELLGRIHSLLLGEDDFYEEVFRSLEVPYLPAEWAADHNPPVGSTAWAEKQARVFRLIDLYRERGHLIADLDPLRLVPPKMPQELDPLTYGLTIWDLDREFATGGLTGRQLMPLGEILGVLRDAYCRTLAIEYSHIQQPERKAWLQERLEGNGHSRLPREQRRRILAMLNQAEGFERFLHTKYLGQKRFSLEGAESIIPALDTVLDWAIDDGMDEVVIGMAHRGRLNVLANIVGKGYERVFAEFTGTTDDGEDGTHSGDVKYHLGATGLRRRRNKDLVVGVVANPSHLEAVDPVLEGIVRAKQERYPDGSGRYLVLPVLIHGDAAFSGQGVVMETLHLSLLDGYRTGGTVHFVVNNQVGFTTSAAEARSSYYATDVAKAVNAPILHVNGDDPEAVVRSAELAFAYRQAFHTDVVIDLLCYRRRGHNEGDEPSYTQPRMYRVIDGHPTVRERYLERLVTTGDLTDEDAAEIVEEFEARLALAFDATKDLEPAPGVGGPILHDGAEPDTRSEAAVIADLADVLTTVPAGFTIHPKLVPLVERRRSLVERDEVDWAMGEALAFATLALEGFSIRLAGEDVGRGTFSHRHAVLVDHVTAAPWTPLKQLEGDGVRIRIHDSLLSEFAALGFEYGYSVEEPGALVVWEAQFGDFANGAQVIIDQFISAGEDKWNQTSGVVMLLPHGFEGQGPEHSSARIERMLTLCAEGNLRVAVPSTAANYHHLLRRQMHLPHRKPLVVFTPKSLLRSAASFGSLADLTDGGFRRVIPDPRGVRGARRVVCCSGKLYYELAEVAPPDVALTRVELLHPVPEAELAEVFADHPGAEVVWAQEEPENMGAWTFLRPHLRRISGREPRYVGRSASASPATGSPHRHAREQAAVVAAAVGG